MYVFVKNSRKVDRGSRVIAKGEKTGTLYLISSSDELNATVARAKNFSLWHTRMGHLGEKGLKVLQIATYNQLGNFQNSKGFI